MSSPIRMARETFPHPIRCAALAWAPNEALADENSNVHYSPHSHGGLTTHLVLCGELTITYPNDTSPKKTTYSVGDRLDVEAGRVHEVWMGDEGCTYVIGE